MRRTLLSFDPGGTTGVALFEYDDSSYELIRTWQIPNGLNGFKDWYYDEEDITSWCDEIVCESFDLREGVHGVDLTPCYVIGSMETLFINVPVLYQKPSMKPLCDDKRLKKMGLHEPGKNHANDAVRHGIIYLRNKRHAQILKEGWGD